MLTVRLTPKGGRDAIDGVEATDRGVMLKARVRAAPTEGEANAALVRLLAKSLNVAPRDVEVVSGATARIKRVMIAGDGASLGARLDRILGKDA